MERHVSIGKPSQPRSKPRAIGELGQHSVKSVEKAFAVLEAFDDSGRTLSLSEIAAITGLDKSAVQRFARTLRQLGYLEQCPETRRYAIGIKVLGLSFRFLHANPHVMRAAPILVNLRNATMERVDMSLVDGDATVYVFRLQSRQEPLKAALVGRRMPIVSSAGGRAILSHLPTTIAREIVQRAPRKAHTPKTLTDPERIMEEVASVRPRGYAFQVEEWRLGEMVVAAAVLDREGRPIGAIHIAASTNDWVPETFARKMGPLVAAAAEDAAE